MKPFHESVVDMINDNPVGAHSTFETIGEMLLRTKLPKDHDVVSAAWMKKADEHIEDKLGTIEMAELSEFANSVNNAILAQKSEVNSNEKVVTATGDEYRTPFAGAAEDSWRTPPVRSR